MSEIYAIIEEGLKSGELGKIPKTAIFGKWDIQKLIPALKFINLHLPPRKELFNVEYFIKLYQMLDGEGKNQLQELIAFTYQRFTSENSGIGNVLSAAVYGQTGSLLIADMSADFPGLLDDTAKMVEELFGLKESPSKDRQDRTLSIIWHLCQSEQLQRLKDD